MNSNLYDNLSAFRDFIDTLYIPDAASMIPLDKRGSRRRDLWAALKAAPPKETAKVAA